MVEEEQACEKGGAECHRREAAEMSMTLISTRVAVEPVSHNFHTLTAHYDMMKSAERSLLNRKGTSKATSCLPLFYTIGPRSPPNQSRGRVPIGQKVASRLHHRHTQ